jgi:hypothetical protein
MMGCVLIVHGPQGGFTSSKLLGGGDGNMWLVVDQWVSEGNIGTDTDGLKVIPVAVSDMVGGGVLYHGVGGICTGYVFVLPGTS